MLITIPASHHELLEGAIYGIFNTHMPNGDIQSTLVWFNFDGEYIYVNTKRGRVKERNITLNPNISLLAVDTTHPMKYIALRGDVIDVIEENAVEHRTVVRAIAFPGLYVTDLTLECVAL